jgi:hypothetical protein
MQCARCKKSFDDEELRRPTRLLRLATLPVLIVMMGRVTLVQEAMARYCGRCRHNINISLFFIVFMIALVVIIKWTAPGKN